MDFDGFIAACERQWGRLDGVDALAEAPCPSDRQLADLPEQVPGFATENKLMLLNLAVRHLDPDEVYVEVGTWQGLSLIGASVGNDDKRLVACDNFSKMGATRDALTRNLADHCPEACVEVHEADFRGFLESAPWRPARVGAYFYDGPHGFSDQVDALRLIAPHLADHAVIIVDDTEDRPVRAANELVDRHAPALEPVLDIQSSDYAEPCWWNGLQVFRWQADAAPEPEIEIPMAAYLPRLLLWNRAVVYGQRTAHFARQTLRRAVPRRS
jgi:protein O-GlcNAc transferase